MLAELTTINLVLLQYCRATIENLRIVAGEHSLSVESGLEQNRLITRVATHPRYNSATYEDDISLIFVSSFNSIFFVMVRNTMMLYCGFFSWTLLWTSASPLPRPLIYPHPLPNWILPLEPLSPAPDGEPLAWVIFIPRNPITTLVNIFSPCSMLQSGGSISDVLRSVDIPVVSDADCDNKYGGWRTKTTKT